MFTPQRKSWALYPRVSADASNPRTVGGKRKGVAVDTLAAATPPPQATLGENGGWRGGGGGDEVEVWRRFRDEGLLDESVLQRKDREALASRILELENELHEYQYNMGLLLIEKKEWSSSYEEIRLRLSEAEEILKREQAAHIIAISESEKREENLRKALGAEKQCVTDLEKALREMRSAIADVKFTSDKKLTEAHTLEASIEEKYLEVVRKLHSADAKLAEASRKSSEIDRKLDDVEARDRKVQREMFSLNSERKALERDISEQKEHLRDWEKKLQDGQKRLVDGKRFLNEREDRANEADKILKKREEELEEAKKMIEVTSNSLKNKEEDVSLRLRALASKEKDADVKLKNLEKKESDLLEIDEKLNSREQIVYDHNTLLDAKTKEFELELEKNQKSFDEEIKAKVDAVDKQKKEINCKEEQISKRELALENKMEKLKMKEKDLDTKSNALKKWEESVKSDGKKLQVEKEKVMKDSEELMVSRTELEGLRAAIKAEELQIICEKENLKLTSEEREQHLQLQSKLKQEIGKYRMLKETLVKEREALRDERVKFEREWEVLDEKRVTLETEVKKVNGDRERFEKWRQNEQERLKNEELQAKAEIERQLEDLRLKKETLGNTMEHERSVAREDMERQLADVARELELRKHDLEMNIQKRQEDVEKRLQEKAKEFEMRKEIEHNRITSSIDLNDLKIRKLKVEQDRLEREKEELSLHKKKLEAEQVEIQKDIDTLCTLSKNLKDQHAEFVKEKEAFLAAAEQCKTCDNCGVSISGLEAFGLQTSRTEIENADILLPHLADGYMEDPLKGTEAILSPQGTGSRSFGSGFLQKCTRLFKFSPGKNVENSTQCRSEQRVEFGERLDMVASEDATNYGVANNSSDAQRAELGGDSSMKEDLERQDKAGDEPEKSLGVGYKSIDIVRMSDYGVKQAEGEPVVAYIDEQKGTEGSSRPPESDFQPKQRRRQPAKRGRPEAVKRTRSVKAVVEDAKAILGGTSDLEVDGESNGDANDSQHIDEERQGDSAHTDQGVATNSRQKRHRPHTSEMTNSELEADNEAHSQSLSMGGCRKRRQTSAIGVQAPGDRRYNLRHSTVAGSSRAASDQAKGQKAASHQPLPGNEISKGDHVGEGTPKDGANISPSSGFVEENNNVVVEEKENNNVMLILQKCTTRNVMEVSSKREMVEVCVESDVIRPVENSERTAEDGDEVDGAPATNEPATPSASEDGDDLEDEEYAEKHNASIGKKLWDFFTT